MGGSLSRRLFPRAKDLDTYGLLLESLDAELEALSRRRAATLVAHRRLVRALVLYSSAAALVVAAVAYAAPHSYGRSARVAPLVALPIGVWLLKKAIDAVFHRSLLHHERIMGKLEKQKERMLEELMEQTNFTRTQQLISKFQRKTQQQHQQQQQPPASGRRAVAGTVGAPPATPQRRAPPGPASATPSSAALAGPPLPPSSSSPSPSPSLPSVSLVSTPFTPPHAMGPAVLPGQPYVTPADLARFSRADIQRPSRRSALDKVVDFVLGDGPNNRFALICASCYTHNGLVRPEEVATIRYRCVFCNWVNSPQRLPQHWTPTIHGSTQTAIIQSTPTQHPQQQRRLQPPSDTISVHGGSDAAPRSAGSRADPPPDPQPQSAEHSEEAKQASEHDSDIDNDDAALEVEGGAEAEAESGARTAALTQRRALSSAATAQATAAT